MTVKKVSDVISFSVFFPLRIKLQIVPKTLHFSERFGQRPGNMYSCIRGKGKSNGMSKDKGKGYW